MGHELEAAAADSARGWLNFRRSKPHTAPPGSPCANCGATLQGPWCHACGQLGEDFHRSAVHLITESFEGLFHFDSRIWRTLPDLAVRPGRLTRAYLDGHRAPQVPPLRLFLVTLLLVFFAGSLGADPAGDAIKLNANKPADRAALEAQIGSVKVSANGKPDAGASAWLQQHLLTAVHDPERFKLILESWAERFAFLMLPISALLLSAVFVFQRRFFLFDHLIFSLHSLSFQGLLLSVVFLVSRAAPWLGGWLLLAAPVHLFVHLRGVYGASILGALVRMVVLAAGALVGFVFLVLGLLWVGLNAMGSA